MTDELAVATQPPDLRDETFRELLRQVSEFRQQRDHFVADVCVMTEAAYAQVRQHSHEAESGLSTFGIAYEVYPTELECQIRAGELWQSGEQVLLVI